MKIVSIHCESVSLEMESENGQTGLKRVENFVERNNKILSPNHYLILLEKSKYFFSSDDMNEGTTLNT